MLVQQKAAFLFIVFFINMMKVLAWTSDTNMRFNTGTREIKITACGKSHHPGKTDKYHKLTGSKGTGYNDHITKSSHGRKYFPQGFFGLNTLLTTTLAWPFHIICILPASVSFHDIRYFVRGHHPPIPDIRGAIRGSRI